MDPIVNAREPRGEEGRRFLEHMNADHEEMARWGTSFLMIGRDYDVLDVGCGGGRNVQYFLERCDKGTVTGIDMSEMSVKVSKEVNSEEIEKEDAGYFKVMSPPFHSMDSPSISSQHSRPCTIGRPSSILSKGSSTC